MVGVKFPTYPATKSQSILLHNLNTIQLWTKILVQRNILSAGLILEFKFTYVMVILQLVIYQATTWLPSNFLTSMVIATVQALVLKLIMGHVLLYSLSKYSTFQTSL